MLKYFHFYLKGGRWRIFSSFLTKYGHHATSDRDREKGVGWNYFVKKKHFCFILLSLFKQLLSSRQMRHFPWISTFLVELLQFGKGKQCDVCNRFGGESLLCFALRIDGHQCPFSVASKQHFLWWIYLFVATKLQFKGNGEKSSISLQYPRHYVGFEFNCLSDPIWLYVKYPSLIHV